MYARQTTNTAKPMVFSQYSAHCVFMYEAFWLHNYMCDAELDVRELCEEV